MPSTPALPPYFRLSFQHACGSLLRAVRRFGDRLFFFLMIRRPPRSSPFPYTTPFRTIGLSAVVPTEDVRAQAMRFGRDHPEFAGQFRTALGAAGFDAGAFAPFFEAYSRHVTGAKVVDLDRALGELQAKLIGPVGLLMHTGRPLSWFVTIAQAAPAIAPPAETHTVSANQLQSLNQVFSRYRQSALWLSLTGLAIVGAGVLLSYGWRDGARIFAIPCGACLGLFGLFGWLGHPLNLFHLLGAFLGVC